MRLLLAAGLAVVVLTAGAARPTQGPTGIGIVDSAAVGRCEYGRGLSLLRSGDSAAALVALTHAAEAWPTQPAYVWARAVIAARMGNAAVLLDALTDYADLSLRA
jgi:hypothetical protein